MTIQPARENAYPGSAERAGCMDRAVHADCADSSVRPMPLQYGLKKSFFSLDAFFYLCACAVPSLIMLLCISLFIGDAADVARFFKEMKAGNPLLTVSLKIFTNWFNFLIYAFYAVILFRAVKNKDARGIRFVIVFAVAQLLVAFLLVRVFKVVIGRARPSPLLRMEPEFSPFSLSSAHHSFPSGHAAEITGLTSVLALWFRRHYITVACSLINTLASFSRIYLSWHHVSDVVAGILAGAVVTFIVHYLCMRDRP